MHSRSLARQATMDMAQARIWQGWGAGSFRYVFPMYQRNYPDIYFRTHAKHGYFGRLHWRYAHNDLLQFLAEYGVIGCSLLILSILSLLFSGFKFQLSALWLLLGVAGMAVHAFFDFILSSPAVWISLIALLSLIPGLSQSGRSGKPAH